jgi:uncharacterized protein YxjI
MKLYIKQKVFSWRDKFAVFDENQNPLYFAQGEIFSWGRKLRLYDANEREVAFIKQKLMTFLRRYIIEINGECFTLVKDFTFFKPSFRIENTGWTISGDFWEHDYTVMNGSEMIMHLSKHWLTWGDSYELDIPDNENVPLALSIALAVDCINADTQQAAAASS